MKHENEDNYTFGFETKQQEDGSWVCMLACRSVAFAGPTEAHAIGGMLKYVAELARSGALSPSRPHEIGVGPIQHALEVVEEQLGKCLQLRFERYRDLNAEAAAKSTSPAHSAEMHDAVVKDPSWLRGNDEIAALGTAIAALARVKEL